MKRMRRFVAMLLASTLLLSNVADTRISTYAEEVTQGDTDGATSGTSEEEKSGKAAISKHSYENLPSEFSKFDVTITSDGNGYDNKSNGTLLFNFKIEMNSEELEKKKTELEEIEDFPYQLPTQSTSEWLATVKSWLNTKGVQSYTYEVEIDPNQICTNTDAIEIETDNILLGTVQKTDKNIIVKMNPICCFLDDISVDQDLSLNVNSTDWNDKQEIVLGDDGKLLFQTYGKVEEDKNQADKPDYSIEKTAPSKVSTTEITYTIQVDALKNEKYLNGLTVKDIVPNGLEIANAEVCYNNGSNQTITIEENGTFLIPQVGEDVSNITTATFIITMSLNSEKYAEYITNNSINEIFKNKAQLYNNTNENALCESEEVSTQMNSRFISKTGKNQNLEGTTYAWEINMNTQLPSLEYGYLVDTLRWTDHTYDLNKGIDIWVDGNVTYHISNITQISNGDFKENFTGNWSTLTALEINKQVSGEFNTSTPSAYYYLIDEVVNGNKVENPFYTEGGTEPRYVQRAILIIPFKNLQGGTEPKSISVRYNTNLNMHGLTSQEYWDKIEEKDNDGKQIYQPVIENDCNLLWKNTNGNGPGPRPQDIVNADKDVMNYPGAIKKTGKKYDQKTQTVTWKIEVNKLGTTMENAVLTDVINPEYYDLSTVKIYEYKYTIGQGTDAQKIETQKWLENNQYSLSTENGQFQYKMGNLNPNDMRVIEISAKLKSGNILAYQSDASYTQQTSNTAGLSYGSENQSKNYTSTAEINVPNTLIKKSAEGIYNKEVGTLEWCITVNPNNLPIEKATVSDTIPTGFSNVPADVVVTKVYKAGKQLNDVDAEKITYSISGNTITFDLGTIDKEYKIYFTTKATSDWKDNNLKYTSTHTTVDVKNEATLVGEIYGKNILNATAEAIHHIALDPIEKRGVYDKDKGTIDWTVVVNAEGYDLKDLKLQETLTKSGDNQIHTLDPDFVEVSYWNNQTWNDAEKDIDYQFDSFTEDEFIMSFSGAENQSNRKKYQIKFTTFLNMDGSAYGAKISNVVYLKNGDDVVSASSSSDGGYDGSFKIEASNKAYPRPNLHLRKISVNSYESDADAMSNTNTLGLQGGKFILQAHKFSLSEDGTSVIIGENVAAYNKTKNSNSTGDVYFTGLKLKSGNDELIYVLTEDSAPEGYTKDTTPFLIYYYTQDDDPFKNVNCIRYEGDETNLLNKSKNNLLSKKGKDNEWSILNGAIKNTPVSTDLTLTKKQLKWASFSKTSIGAKDYENVGKGVTFSVTKTDNPSQVITKTFTTNDDGQLVINGLDEGTYTLAETKPPAGMKPGSVKLTVTYNSEDKNYNYELKKIEDNALQYDSGTKTLLNNEPKTTSILFNKYIKYSGTENDKTFAGKKVALSGVKFKIRSVTESGEAGYPASKANEYIKGSDEKDITATSGTDEKDITATSGTDGKVEFSNLPIGKYEIYEIPCDANKGYGVKSDTKVLDVTIADDSKDISKLAITYTTVENLGAVKEKEKGEVEVEVYNFPVTGTISFTKKQGDNGTGITLPDASLNGAEFGLYRKIGNTVAKEPIYKATSSTIDSKVGTIQFTGVDFGTYVLQEITAPTGYDKSTPTIDIKITLQTDNETTKDTFSYSLTPDDENKLTNNIHKESLILKKQNEDNESLSGVCFDVYRRGSQAVDETGSNFVVNVLETTTSYYKYNPLKNDTVCAQVKTDTNGEIALNNLPFGDYLFVEHTTGDGAVSNIRSDCNKVGIRVQVTATGMKVYEHEAGSGTGFTKDDSKDSYTVDSTSGWTEIAKIQNNTTDTPAFHIINHLKYGYVNLNKKMAENNGNGTYTTYAPLAGATFVVKKKGEEDPYLTLKTNSFGKFTVNSDGSYTDSNDKTISKHLWYGTYTIEETAAPDGYAIVNSSSIEFVVSDEKTGHNGTAWIYYESASDSGVTYIKKESASTTSEEKAFVNTVKRNSISLIKKSGDTVLSGAEFEVKSGDTVVAYLKESNDTHGNYVLTEKEVSGKAHGVENSAGVPYLLNGSLLYGTYSIVEITAPKGYEKASDTTITIGDTINITSNTASASKLEASSSTIVLKDNPVEITLKKVNKPTTGSVAGIAGVKFSLKGIFADSTNEATKEYTTGTDGTVTSSAELIIGNDYILKEVSAPDSYVVNADEIKLHVEDDGTVTIESGNNNKLVSVPSSSIVTMQNCSFVSTITLHKEDASDKADVAGTMFTVCRIVGETSTKVGDYTTNASGNISIPLDKRGTYRIVETQSGTGYVNDGFEATFTLDNADYGETKTINLAAKKTETGGWLTVVNGDSLLTTNGVKNNRATGQVTLTKKGTDDANLKGVTFELYKKSDDWIDTLLKFITGKTYSKVGGVYTGTDLTETGELTIKDLEWGTYKLVETVPVAGYTTNEKNGSNIQTVEREFTIGRNGTNITMKVEFGTITNITTQFTMVKTDSGSTESKLANAVYKVTGTFANTTDIEKSFTTDIEKSFTTDANGQITINGLLIAGNTYTIEETKAPNGYELNTQMIKIRVEKDGKIYQVNSDNTESWLTNQTLNLTDDQIQITVKKNDGNSNKLSGSKFTFTDVTDTTKLVSKTIELKDGSINLLGTDNSVPLIQNHSYELVETVAPDGYILPGSNSKISFSVGTDGKLNNVSSTNNNASLGTDGVTLSITNTPIFVKLTKTDYTDNHVLKGVNLQLKDITNTSAAIKELGETDEKGEISVGSLIQNHTYEIYEKTYAGYQGSSDAVKVLTFSVNTDGTVTIGSSYNGVASSNGSNPANISLKNKRIPGTVVITKVGVNDNVLSGAEFTLYHKNADGTCGSNVETKTTNSNGKATFSNIPWGEYIIKETKAPDGHKLDSTEHQITIDAQHTSINVTLTNEKNGVSFQKYDKEDSTLSITGAEFSLKAEDGSKFSSNGTAFADGFDAALKDDDKTISWKSKKDAVFTINGYLVAGKIYVLTEEKAPDGYELPTEHEWKFKMETSGAITWITGSSYAQASIQANEIQMLDQKIKICLNKVDENNNSISGSEFVIKDITSADETKQISRTISLTNGTVMLTGTDADVPIIQGHKYSLSETKVPAGYVKMQDTEFSVDAEGKVTVAENSKKALSVDNTNDTVELKAKNVKTKLSIEKIDNETGEELASPELVLTLQTTEANPVKVFDWKYNDNKYSLEKNAGYSTISIDENSGIITGIPAGTYTLLETGTPNGYQTISPYVFTIKEDGTIEQKSISPSGITLDKANNKITAIDNVIRGQVELTKSATNSIVQGTKFRLYKKGENDASDSLILDNIVVDENGKWESATPALSQGLRTGNYYFVEVQATADTVLDSETKHEFTIGDTTKLVDGKLAVSKVNVTNDHFGASVTLKKIDAENKAPIKGVTFKLTCVPEYDTSLSKLTKTGTVDASNKKITWEATTDDNGNITFNDDGKGLPKGQYTLTEEKAVYGYTSDGQGTPNDSFRATFGLNDSDNGKKIVINKDASIQTDEISKNLLSDKGIINHRTLGSVTLQKKDQSSDESLNGVTFTLYRKSDATGLEAIKEFLTGTQYKNYTSVKGEDIAENDDGKLTIDNLPWGEYILKETLPANGYQFDLDSDGIEKEYEFTIGREGTDVSLTIDKGTIYNNKTLVTLIKTDSSTGAKISGAEFTFTNTADNTDVHVEEVNSAGTLTLTGVLRSNATYSVEETKYPDGYMNNNTSFTASLDKAGKISISSVTGDVTCENNVITIKNTQTHVEFLKIGYINEKCADKRYGINPDATKALQGVTFAAYKVDEAGNVDVTATATTISGEDGNVVFDKLPLGKYQFVETQTTAGYQLDKTPYYGKVISGVFAGLYKDKDLTQKVADNTLINDVYRTDIHLLKVDEADNSKVIAGATYGLYRYERNLDYTDSNCIAKATTDKKGTLTFEGVLLDQLYVIKELEAPAGCYRSSGLGFVQFTRNESNEIVLDLPLQSGQDVPASVDKKENQFVMTWKEPVIEVQISKLKEQSTAQKPVYLAGATLQILSSDKKKVIKEFTSAENVASFKGILEAGKTYYLHEVSSPAGYGVAEDVEFTVPSDNVASGSNTPVKVEMTDSDITFSLWKKDSNGNAISGTVFEMTGKFADNPNEEQTKTYTSTATEIVLDKVLVAGETYKIQEVSTPDGYVLNKQVIEIAVAANGTVICTNLSDLSDVSLNDDVMTVVNTSFKASVKLEKYDAENGNALSGVTFLLERKNTGEADEKYVPYVQNSNGGKYLTDENGLLSITIQDRGDYRLTEKSTVYGYTNGKDNAPITPFVITFALKNEDQGKTITVNNKKQGFTVSEGEKLLTADGLANTRAEGSVTLTKVDSKDESIKLSGVTFTLYKENETKNVFEKIKEFFTGKKYHVTDEIDGGILDEKGELTITGLSWGNYKLVETMPHAGYKDEQIERLFTIDNSNLTAAMTVSLGKIENTKTVIHLEKRDSETKALIDGATLRFTNVNDASDAHDTIVSGGKATLSGVLSANQTYRVEEIKYPSQYKANLTPFNIKLNANGDVSIVNGTDCEEVSDNNTLVVYNEPGKIVFTKVGLINESCAADSSIIDRKESVPLGGVEFKLYQSKEQLEKTPNAPYRSATSDVNGKVVFNHLPAGTYWIKEVSTVAGYILDTNIYQATVNAGEFEGIRDASGKLVENNEWINDVYRANIVISKVNEQNTDEVLPGSTYGLYRRMLKTRALLAAIGTGNREDYEEVFVCSATTDKDGMLTFEGVCMGQDYVIRELIAPDGSYVSQDPIEISFKVDKAGNVVVNSFSDGSGTGTVDTITGEIVWFEPSVEVLISKMDMENHLLAGAVLQILDEDGNEVLRFTSGTEPKLISRVLTIGKTYTLVELKAPDGYKTTDPFSFTIDDASVPAGQNKKISVYMQDEPIVMTITNTDASGKPITGAQFKIEGVFADGTTEKIITIEDANTQLIGLLIAGNEYVMTQLKAADGYQIMKDPITFTVDPNGDIVYDAQSVVLTNGTQLKLEGDTAKRAKSNVKTGDVTHRVPIAGMLVGIAVTGYAFTKRRKKTTKTND